jgi:hypothetical protein
MKLGRSAALGVMAVACAVWSSSVHPRAAGAQAREVAGMITEIKIGAGRVEVRPAGTAEWRPAAPLLSLGAGDEIRATNDARVVVLPSGSKATITLGAAESPFRLRAAALDETKLGKARTLLQSSVAYLSASRIESRQAILATRGTKPPLILGPRNGPVLPDALAFEWRGSPGVAYTVRVLGPGVAFERHGVMGARLVYPSDAAALSAGSRYILEVVGPGHPTQQSWFEVVDAERARVIRRDLADLATATADVSANTRAVLEAGLLASNGLIHEATRTVAAAVARDPAEPTLYLLLGNLLESSGLNEEAADAFRQARVLLGR